MKTPLYELCDGCACETLPEELTEVDSGLKVCGVCLQDPMSYAIAGTTGDSAPVGWLVYCPDGCEFESLIYPEDRRNEAEAQALEYAAEHHADAEWVIIPLYAGKPITVK